MIETVIKKTLSNTYVFVAFTHLLVNLTSRTEFEQQMRPRSYMYSLLIISLLLVRSFVLLPLNSSPGSHDSLFLNLIYLNFNQKRHLNMISRERI